MLYRKIIGSVALLSLIGVSNAIAAKKEMLVDESVKTAWNAPSSQRTGFLHDIDASACIGVNPNCSPWIGGTAGNISGKVGTESDEGAVLVLLAHKINTNGAKFCVTQVQAANRDRNWSHWGLGCWFTTNFGSWTEYYSPSGASSNCFWLCKNGFYGDGCQQTTPPSLYDVTPLKRDAFKDYKRLTVASSANIEDTLPMFYMNHYTKAHGGHKSYDGEEHDTVLIVTRWLDSGNGAYVAPVAVHAMESITDEGSSFWFTCNYIRSVSTPSLEVVGKETLVCKDGYRYNAAGTDCVAANKDIEELSVATQDGNLCAGFEDGFDEKQHVMKKMADCYAYRCATGGFGFKMAMDHECVECTGTPGLFGVANNGACVTCPIGTNFDADDSGAGYCPRAVSYSADALVYGIKGGPADAIADQCWTYTDLEAYKACVKDGVAAAKVIIDAKRSAD